jgi:hypothetical protein
LVLALVRRVVAIGLAGSAAGLLVGGLGGRLVMRLSALAGGSEVVGVLTENGNRVGDITVAGTIGLLIFGGLLSGTFGAILAVISDPWLRTLGRWKGLGTGLFLLFGFGFLVLDSASPDFLILKPALLNVVMFAALFVGFGLAMWAMFEWLDHRLPRQGPAAVTFYVVALSLGLIPLLLLLLTFISADFGGREPARYMAVLLGALGMATAVEWWTMSGGGLSPRLRRLVRFVGFATFASIILVGGISTISNVMRIL